MALIQSRGNPKKKIDTREKVFLVALEEFASKSFREVSTRDITKKAGVNLSSIKYYFGDKEGLYRAVYDEPLREHKEKMNALCVENNKTLEDNLRVILFTMVEPLKEGKEIEWCMMLRMRETIDKTGLVDDSTNEFKNICDYLCLLIKKEIPNIKEETLKRLVFSILSQPVFLFIGKELITSIEPCLVKDINQINAWINKTVFYSLAMINLEKEMNKSV